MGTIVGGTCGDDVDFWTALMYGSNPTVEALALMMRPTIVTTVVLTPIWCRNENTVAFVAYTLDQCLNAIPSAGCEGDMLR
jgi:hypothetical protein